MSIASIQPTLLLPERELIINKSFTLHGNPALLASITEQGGIIKLWLFQQVPEIPAVETEDIGPARCVTHRMEIHRRTSQTRFGFPGTSEMTVQGITLPISKSVSGIIGHDHMSFMKLQHFIEAGVDFSLLENTGFGYLMLSEFQLADGTAYPEIDTGADIPITLRTRDDFAEVIVEPTHLYRLSVGEQTDNAAHSFRDPVSGKEITYYVDRVICHDIWEQAEAQFNDEATLKIWREHGLDDTAIEQMKAQLPESIGRICPKGQEMLLIQYETPDNIQLNFYTSEFLDSEPIRNSGSVGMIGTSNNGDESVHGFPVRTGILKTVPAGFVGTVDVELISWNRTKLGEWIEA